MRIKARVWASAGLLVLLVGLIGSPQPAQGAAVTQFSDVDSWPDWAMLTFPTRFGDMVYGGDLVETVWWELMVGDTPPNGKLGEKRTFRPHDTITRAEYATILTRALGLEISASPGADWFRPAVEALAAHGIVTDAHNFNLPITRREMGEWIGRALSWYGVEILPGESPPLSDIEGLAEASQIKLAASAGVIKGYPDGTFGPEKTATRTEGAAMVIRLAKQLKKNPPDSEVFEKVFRGFWTIMTLSEKEMAAGTIWMDYHLFEPYWTDLYLYGPNGYRGNTMLWNGWYGATGKYRELVEVKVTPIMIREAIALILFESKERNVTLEGKQGQPTAYIDYAYMVKSGTTWKVARMVNRAAYPPDLLPQPEEGGR